MPELRFVSEAAFIAFSHFEKLHDFSLMSHSVFHTGSRCLFLALLLSFVCGLDALHAADRTLDSLNVAISYYNRNQYDQAISELRAFLSKNPNHAEKNKAQYYLGEALVQKNRIEEAFACYDDILEKQLSALKITDIEKCIDPAYYTENIHPRMSKAVQGRFAREALFRAGQVAYMNDSREGSLDEARKYLFAFIVEFPEDASNEWVLQYLGSIAMQNFYIATEQGYPPIARIFAEEAEEYFTQVTRLFPKGGKYAENLFGLAWAKNRLGKYSEATPILNFLTTNNSEGELAERAYYELGEMYYDQRNYEQAITKLAYFERRFPQSELLHDSMKMRAKSLAGLKKYKEALALLEKLEGLTPEDYLLQIRCHYGLGDNRKASQLLAELDKLPESETIRDTIRSMQAAEIAAKGDLKKAISSLETMLRAKYDTRTKEMSFGYFDPPERNSQRARGSDFSSTMSFPNAPFSSKGKLTEESFLMACSILCLCYSNAGEKDKSYATLDAMMNFGKSDDERHNQIVSKTEELLVKGVSLSGLAGGGTGSNGGGVQIPIDPGLDGGIDFGSIIVVEDSMFDPIGGVFQPPKDPISENYEPGKRPGQNNRPNREDESGKELVDNKRPGNSRPGSSRPGSSRPNSNENSSASTGKRQEHQRALQECRRLIERNDLETADEKLLELLGTPSLLPQTGAEAAYLRCKVLLEQGREDDAQVMCEYILSEFHNSTQYAKALWISGEYYEKNGRPEDALEYYNIITEEFPNDSNADGAWFNLGWYELSNKDYSKAKRYFRKVYTGYPEGEYWSHATWGLAYIAYMEREDKMAETLVREVLMHPPDAAILDRTLYLKGLLAVRNEDWKTAEIAFETFLRQTEDRNGALARSAQGYISQARNQNSSKGRR